MHDTIFFSACDLINLYKSKKLSPVENLKNTFDVIKKLNPKLNAFISMSEKKAMKQAKFSELHYLNNTERKLEGIPFGVKDVIDVQQEKTMNGSKLFETSEVKKNNSTVVKKLIDEEVRFLAEEAENNCRKILQDNIEELHIIAKGLLEYETLTGDEIKRVIKGEPPHGDDDLDGDVAKSDSTVKESVML